MVAFSVSADDEDRSSKAPKEKKKGGRRLSMLLGRMNKKLDNAAESGSRVSSIGDGQSFTSWTKRGGRGSKRFSIWGASTRGDRDSSACGTSSVDPNPASRKGLGLGFSTRFSTRHLPVAPNPPKEAKSAKKEAKKEVKKAAPPKEEEKDERSRAERIKEKSEKQEVERKKKEEEQRKMREQAAASEESVFERRARCAAGVGRRAASDAGV